MAGLTCTACGAFYKEPFEGFPFAEQLCEPCWSARDLARSLGRFARLDKDGRCGFCGADIVGSVSAHEELCSFKPTLEEVSEALTRKDARR